MEKTTKILIAAVFLIIVIAVSVFLFTSDDGGITGWQALGLLDYGFWIPIVLCLIGSGGAVYFAVAKAKTDKAIIAAVIVAAVLFFSPWGKACTVKADPVQAPKYVPAK